MALRKRTDLIVIHCSATKPSQDISAADIDAMHRARGFARIGYHYVIRRDGVVEVGRPGAEIGAHVEGFNSTSVGVCMIGGLDEDGKEMKPGEVAPFTDAQWAAARTLVASLRRWFPTARVVGHRDLSPDLNGDGQVQPREWLKTCPGFDASAAFPV